MSALNRVVIVCATKEFREMVVEDARKLGITDDDGIHRFYIETQRRVQGLSRDEWHTDCDVCYDGYAEELQALLDAYALKNS